MSDKNMMLSAADEIEGLRQKVGALELYHRHTERLLALFEGGPRKPEAIGMGEDVAWRLRKRAEELAKQEPTSGK